MTTIGDILSPILLFVALVLVVPLIIMWALDQADVEAPPWLAFGAGALIWGLVTGIIQAIWTQELPF